MTPEEKAKELIEKFKPLAHKNFNYKDTGELDKAKHCALIAATNEISTLSRIQEKFDHNTIEGMRIITTEIKYLTKVKESINKL